jgi:hypothetical protein
MKRLVRIRIDSSGIVDERDAALYDRLFQMKQLRYARLNSLCIESEASADIVCSALANCYLKGLTALNWTFVESKQSALARALTSSSLERLLFYPKNCGVAFYKEFGQGLTKSSIKKLLIAPNCDHHGASLLQFAPTWQLKHLYLRFICLRGSQEFKHHLMAYLADNTYLRHLELKLLHRNLRDASESYVALNSIDWSKTALDEIDITGWKDAPWIAQIRQLVASNLSRQRRLHCCSFERIATVDSGACRSQVLTKALAAVDASTCFAFLSANEWRCRDVMLQEMPLVPESRKRKRKRSVPSKIVT